MAKYNNPVLETYKGIDVCKYNVVRIKLSPQEFKELIDIQETTGLSQRKILAYSGKPCEKCKGISVMYFDDDGNSHEIKRGFLSRRIPESNGINKLKQANAKALRNSQKDNQ